MKITYDFGHGTGWDKGVEGYRNEEHDCREYGTLVIEKLQSLGHVCYNCTPDSNPDLSLGQSLAYRVNKANSIGSALHISMHVNAYKTDKANGCEVEYISDSGKAYAERVCNEMSSDLGFINRGAQYRPYLYLLKYTNMVAILIEPFFCDARSDCDKYNAEKLAAAIVKGITGQIISIQTQNIFKTIPEVQLVPKYDETSPMGTNIYHIPNTKSYVEQREDGGVGFHLDKENYIVMKKGEIAAYWNDNNGHAGSKKLSD